MTKNGKDESRVFSPHNIPATTEIPDIIESMKRLWNTNPDLANIRVKILASLSNMVQMCIVDPQLVTAENRKFLESKGYTLNSSDRMNTEGQNMIEIWFR